MDASSSIHTFTPSINKSYPLPDRVEGDVLRSMQRKEALAKVRMEDLKRNMQETEVSYTFCPKINSNSTSLLSSSHLDSPVYERIGQRDDEARLKLNALKYDLENFDNDTGQKLFKPKIDSHPPEGTGTTWRSRGGAGDNDRSRDEESEELERTLGGTGLGDDEDGSKEGFEDASSEREGLNTPRR